MRECSASGAEHAAIALRSEEVFPPPDPPVVVLRGALAAGTPSYDAVLAEHVPLMPGGESCRSCGFVYAAQRICPALILAAAGYPVLADRIRIVPADREYGALCELSVTVARMDARLAVLGSHVTAVAPRQQKRRLPRWVRIGRLPDPIRLHRR